MYSTEQVKLQELSIDTTPRMLQFEDGDMLHALVAEDDSVSATLLGRIIERYGEVKVVPDGELAFIAYQEAITSGTPFDVIFLDIMMPGVEGQETLEAIRQDERERGIPPEQGVKVIMVTALNDGTNLYQAHRQGCADYLHKPIGRSVVEETLRKLQLIPQQTPPVQ